ncbi:uncharacterized protein LOC132554500 [Ylistrum balloti]|uniref:uncharacterized protein LOC132554500 n=1 Tax=Ylistrum balloti TaxID=509963 RepID=UPI0029059FC9|nr:uncharacterized protein LOC132554500 [Ylistrum balloti]
MSKYSIFSMLSLFKTGAIQLNSYKSSGDRKVEVFRENVYRELKWRGLCSTCWTNHNTDVVCKQYGFMCKGTGNRTCKCGTDAEFWDTRTSKCQERSNFSAVFVPLTQTFQSAREFCIEKLGGNLALPEEVQHLFLECAMYDADIWLEHVSLYKEMDIEYDTTEKTRQCLYGTKSGGMLYTNGQVDCSETFSFLCVVNGSTYSNSTKCKKFNEFHEAVNTPVQSTDPLPMIIVGVSVFVILVIVLTGAVCLYKRVLYDTRKENNSGVDKLNIDTDPENQYDSTSDVMETNHYGYGVLGGKRGENAGNDMYSQSGQLNNKDEYDTFIRKEEDTDVNDMYDHTRAVTHEDHYDEFQKQK